MPYYDFINTIRIKADNQDQAYTKYVEAIKGLDINLSEIEEVNGTK